MEKNSGIWPTVSTVIFSFPPLIFIFKGVDAYIDAGTGSLIIQFLIAGAVGGIVLVRGFWRRIKAFFDNHFSKSRKGND